MWPIWITVDDDLRRLFVRRLKRAIQLAGLTEQQACQEMLLKQSQWADQCAGEEHLSFTRLMLLPLQVHLWFAVLTLVECGLPVELDSFMGLFGHKKRMVSHSGGDLNAAIKRKAS